MNGLEILLATLLILYLPITWAIVFYWSNKAKQYWLPVASCVLAHVALLPLLIIWGDVDIIDDFDIAQLILLFILFALSGIVISALVILYVTKHRNWVLSILLLFSAFTLSPLLDYVDVDFDPTTYTVSLLQGSETDFQGYKIHLGDTYTYRKYKDELIIEIIKPGFAGVEYYNLYVSAGTKEKIEELDKACLDKLDTCVQVEQEAYQTIFYTENNSLHDNIWSANFYYNTKCDVYLMYRHNEIVGVYTDFIERFFNDNCS